MSVGVKREIVTEMASRATQDEAREPELALVERATKGDKEAYRVLVEKYQNRVYSLVLSMTKSKEDAEDIVQESFVKAYLSLKNFRGDSSFYTWIYRVAFNMAIDFQRRNSRRGEVLTSQKQSEDGRESKKLEAVATDGNPEETAERKQLAVLLSNAMSQLSEEHRTVVMLREVDGMSYAEIADVLGLSQGTVMSRIHYAKKYLQKALKDLA